MIAAAGPSTLLVAVVPFGSVATTLTGVWVGSKTVRMMATSAQKLGRKPATIPRPGTLG